MGLPLPDLCARFTELALPGKAKSTRTNYRRAIELAKALPDHPAPGDVAVWIARLRQHYGPRTVDLHYYSLRAIYVWGGNLGLVTGNPVALCPFVQTGTDPRSIEGIQTLWPRMLAAMPDLRARAFLEVMRYMGLRRGEALGVMLADILPPKKRGGPHRLAVRRQRNAGDLNLSHTFPLKGSKPGKPKGRVVPIHPAAWRDLDKLLSLGAPVVAVGKGGGERVETKFLFPYTVGQLDRISEALQASAPEVLTPGTAFHALRHTLACELAELGRSTEQVRDLLGHTYTKTTDRYLQSLVGREVSESIFDGIE